MGLIGRMPLAGFDCDGGCDALRDVHPVACDVQRDHAQAVPGSPDGDADAGQKAEVGELLEDSGVVVGHSEDGAVGPFVEVGQGGGGICVGQRGVGRGDSVAVGVVPGVPQCGVESADEGLGDGVFEVLGLFVHLVPRVPQPRARSR